jgi:Ca-activated chloride channel family protein
MDFASPHLAPLAAAAPLLAALAAWAWRRRFAATAGWAARGLWDRLLPGHSPARTTVSALLLAVAVLGVVLALARPRWGRSDLQVERLGVDVAFVLDTSLSMATRDVEPDRLWVAQTLVRRMVRELPGHRVALVQAEGDGVVMVPLTSDGAVIDLLLDAVLPGTLPVPGTELARSLDRALGLFPAAGSRHQVLIVMSDGEDHGSGLDGVTAKLATRGIVVHAIGVGTREGMPLELPAFRGEKGVEYKLDEAGNVVVSRRVDATLEALTRATGGVYLTATSPAVDLEPIRAKIDEMEKRAHGSELVNTLEERFQWPVALAVAALSLHLLVAPFRRAEART